MTPHQLTWLPNALQLPWRDQQAGQPDEKRAQHLVESGVAAYHARDYDQAKALLGQALEIAPNLPQAHCNYALVLVKQNKPKPALHHLCQAIALHPTCAQFHHNLGTILLGLKRFDEARDAFTQALALREEYYKAHAMLGQCLLKLGHPSKAIPHLCRSLELFPRQPECLLDLATCVAHQGDGPAAVAIHRQIAKLRPDDPLAASNIPFMLHYDPDCSQRKLFSQHLRFARKFANPLYKTIQPHSNSPDPDRPLRIGYVSGDLHSHPVARFIEAAFENHDKTQFHIFIYSFTSQEDLVTRRIQSYGHTWRDIRKLNDEQAAAQIREDGIDILIDLMGYIGGHRLLLFARKPAPLQITYLGYPNTTALKTIDYKLTDSLHDPPGQNDRFYTEKLLYLDPCAWCYRPDPESPTVNELPALQNGFVTFACLNRLVKASPLIRSLWSKILQAVPGSRLKILVDHPDDQEPIYDLFAQSNIPPDRLILTGRSPRLAYLKQYHSTDIALDSFPYNGHTTTCDCLHMGLPVVSLAGQPHISRAGLSCLTNSGLPHLVAHSADQYIQIALSLAFNLDSLSQLRHSLRPQFNQSPLRDEQSFTRRLEAAFRRAWRSHSHLKPDPPSICVHPCPICA